MPSYTINTYRQTDDRQLDRRWKVNHSLQQKQNRKTEGVVEKENYHWAPPCHTYFLVAMIKSKFPTKPLNLSPLYTRYLLRTNWKQELSEGEICRHCRHHRNRRLPNSQGHVSIPRTELTLTKTGKHHVQQILQNTYLYSQNAKVKKDKGGWGQAQQPGNCDIQSQN